MKVPAVVQMTCAMIAVSATEGPLSHCQSDRLITWVSSRAAGGLPTVQSPSQSPMMWIRPRGSENHCGPSIPNTARNWLTAPVPVKRNRKTSEIATDETTDGK